MFGNQVTRAAFGNFAPMVQHQQTRAQALGLVHEVGGQQNRLALLQQQLQTLPHQVPGLRVQPGGGLVQQQQFGVIDQCSGQTQTPLHAARQLARPGVGLVRQRRKLQQGWDARTDLCVFHAEIAAVHQQVFRAGEVGVQRVHLAHHAKLCLDGQRVLRHLQPQRGNAATGGHHLAQAHADGGGLARAIGANHAQALACGNFKRQVVDDGGIAVTLGEMLH